MKIALAILTLMLMSALPILVSHWREEAPSPGPVMRFEVQLPSGVMSYAVVLADNPISVSPDGRHIAFVHDPTAGGRRVWIRTLASIETRELQLPSAASGVSCSSDSRSLAFLVEGSPKSMDITEGTIETLSVDGSIAPRRILLGPGGNILMTHAGGISLGAKYVEIAPLRFDLQCGIEELLDLFPMPGGGHVTPCAFPEKARPGPGSTRA